MPCAWHGKNTGATFSPEPKNGLVAVARVKGPDLGGRESRALRAPMSEHRDAYDATAPQ